MRRFLRSLFPAGISAEEKIRRIDQRRAELDRSSDTELRDLGKQDLQLAIDSEIPKRLENPETANIDPSRRGTTWTYIVTDQPFGTWMQSALRDWLKKRTEEK